MTIGSLIFPEQPAESLLEIAKQQEVAGLGDAGLVRSALKAAGAEGSDKSRDIILADLRRIWALIKGEMADQEDHINIQAGRLDKVRNLAGELSEAIRELKPQDKDKWVTIGLSDPDLYGPPISLVNRLVLIAEQTNTTRECLGFLQRTIPVFPKKVGRDGKPRKPGRAGKPRNAGRQFGIPPLYQLYISLTGANGALRWSEGQSDHEGPFLEFCKVCLHPVFGDWSGKGLEDDIKKALRLSPENTHQT